MMFSAYDFVECIKERLKIMKTFLKRTAVVLLAVTVTIPFVGCSKQTVEEYSDGVSQFISSVGTDENQLGSENAANPSENTGGSSAVPSGSGQTSTGNGNSGGSSQTTSLTRDQVIASMPKSLKGTTLTYMYWWDPKTQMEGEAIEKFEKATGITVKTIVASYSDFQSQLAARIAADSAPDLVRLLGNQSWQITALQPITNSGFDFNDSAWDSNLMKDFTFNGKTYAANLKNSAISDVAVIYYNMKALDEAEMEDPYTIWKKNPSKWTWAKFWDMCDEFVSANKNKSGYAGTTFEYGDAYVRAMGGGSYTYDSAKGKYVSIIKNSETESGWKTTLEAIENGWLLAEHDETKFDQGKVLFLWSGPFSARKLDSRQKALKDRNRLGVVPLPTDSKVQTMYEYTAFGIPQGAKNAAAVPYYLRYVLDQSSYDMNNVYYNSKAREVVDYACSAENRFYGNGNVDGFLKALVSSGSNQVKSVIDSYSAATEEFVKQENERTKLLSD